MTTVAVVGLGAMGSRIAERLVDVGHDVLVWNRSPEKTTRLVQRGAVAVATPAEAAAVADFLITMVSDPSALRAVSEGDDGIAAGAGASLTVIEMSTVGPPAIVRLAKALPREAELIDAPVLGSIGEAESGALTIFAGGPPPLVERARPLLAALGSVVHAGPLGAGAAAKLVANATLFTPLAALGEAIALARGLGLSESVVYEVLAATPLASQAQRRRQAIKAGDYPPRFSLSRARKDAELIREAANDAGVEVRVGEAARTWFADSEASGLGDRDYTAVLATTVRPRRERSPADVTNNVALERERAVAYDGPIVDLDGVVWLGGDAIEGAVEAVATMRALGTRIIFLTNDPQRSREEHAARLTAIGIPATAADLMTSSAATARFLAAHGDLRWRAAFVIGSPAFRDEIAAAHFEVVSSSEAPRADLVVVGGRQRFDFAELRAATRAIADGAQLFAAGRDAVVPKRDGPEQATGAILAAVETAAGVTATVIGKPEPLMFELAREALAECERVAVVGDNLASDIAGAKRSGLDAILVLSGASREEDLDQAQFQPDLVLPSLVELAAALEAGSATSLTRPRANR
jgi:HAD superfamily hydrolase (TIGR01450 family)